MLDEFNSFSPINVANNVLQAIPAFWQQPSIIKDSCNTTAIARNQQLLAFIHEGFLKLFVSNVESDEFVNGAFFTVSTYRVDVVIYHESTMIGPLLQIKWRIHSLIHCFKTAWIKHQ